MTVMRQARDFINRLKILWRIAGSYDRDLMDIHREISFINRQIREVTKVHVDYHHRGLSTIIVLGHYRNHDYVEVFNLEEESLPDLIDLLKRMRSDNARLGRIDHVPGFTYAANKLREKWR